MSEEHSVNDLRSILSVCIQGQSQRGVGPATTNTTCACECSKGYAGSSNPRDSNVIPGALPAIPNDSPEGYDRKIEQIRLDEAKQHAS